ncbi:hypothetical protein BC937DRAFT_89772 [Endogone sp. FLAS-F59071]|nr:hypothetical protein BC937DRAFT_89772 [Endogone sp. FLAS-F59071]|eukprot:RUS22299.1 hypothetical protein BC937DRAFT_89772 [Endogone sp. FLAS-F59071]
MNKSPNPAHVRLCYVTPSRPRLWACLPNFPQNEHHQDWLPHRQVPNAPARIATTAPKSTLNAHVTLPLGLDRPHRTLAKPVANSIKTQAKQHPSFREFCINVAQIADREPINNFMTNYHLLEMTMKMNFLGYKREVIRPLNDAKSRIQSNRRNHFLDSSIENLNKDSSNVKETMAETQALAKKLQDQVEELKRANMAMQGILNEILSASMGLRSHTAYDRPVVMTLPGFEPSKSRENMIPLAGEQRDEP